MTPEAIDISARLAGLLASEPPRAVAHSSELERIRRLPRRTWTEDDPNILRLTFELSAWLRVPGSSATLRPIQAIALCELYYLRRLFGPMPVGSGKTLVTYLAPTVLGAQRPILILPAKLRDVKTPREFARLSKDWRAPPSLRIISYEQLSRDYGVVELIVYSLYGQVLPGKCSPELFESFTRAGAPVPAHYDGRLWDVPNGRAIVASVFVQARSYGILDLANPDAIIDDEAHRFKNRRAACSKKMIFFMESHPDVPHVDLSGSMTKETIHDFAHILDWTHKGDTPVPRDYNTRKEWGQAIDATIRYDEERLQAGALLEFATPEERRTLDALTAARHGFRRRLVETPGVVAYEKQYTGASLLVREAPEPDYDPITETYFEAFRLNGLLPNNTTTAGGLDDWRHERTMALGFYTTPKYPPPMPWRVKRTEWGAACRRVLNDGQKGLESPFQVARVAALEGHAARKYTSEMWVEARRTYRAWKEIEPTFTPEMITKWFDDAAINFVAQWMEDRTGLVWVEHIEFAERLSEETGAPYFHREGLDARKRYIEDADPKEGSIIVSIEANYEGRNLQYKWSDNLFTSLPKGAQRVEQTIGRTHRDEQPEDEVTVDIMIPCAVEGEAWLRILDQSQYIRDSHLPAKILYADVVMPDREELSQRAARSKRFASKGSPSAAVVDT